MEITERARHIIDHVLAMDDQWGKPSAPRKEGSGTPSRLITDECRWHARLTRQDQRGPDGELWDLIEVHAYEQLRMTAAFRGDQVDVRLYDPGTWEALFVLFGEPGPTRRRPNDGTDWEM